MMNAQRIINNVTAEPFRPFRIHMTSGKSYLVRHPEMVAVGKTTVHVFTTMSEVEEEAKEKDQELSMLLIESIEPVDLAQETHSNRN